MQYGYEAVRSFKLPITVGKRQEHRKTYPLNMHFHNGYEVFLVTPGRYRIFAPQKLYEGEGACAMFVNRGVYHCTVRLDCETLPFCGYDLYFLQSVVDMMPPALLNMEPLLENNLVVIPLGERELAYFEPKLAEMREIDLATRGSGKNPPVLYGLLLAVVNRLADLCGERGAQKFSAGSEGDLYITDVSKCIIEAVDAGRDIGVADRAHALRRRGAVPQCEGGCNLGTERPALQSRRRALTEHLIWSAPIPRRNAPSFRDLQIKEDRHMKRYVSPAIQLLTPDTVDILTGSTGLLNDHYTDEPTYWNFDNIGNL